MLMRLVQHPCNARYHPVVEISAASTRARILEGLVTTLPALDRAEEGDPDIARAVNVAPMGPLVDDAMSRLVLRPFTSSTTYQNLKATGVGVFHVTDDALMIARGAIGILVARWRDAAEADAEAEAIAMLNPNRVIIREADRVHGVVLIGACRYYEFEVTSLDDSQERTRIEAKVIHAGHLRDFFGFCRAKHAVLEAAILATRVHLTGPAAVLAEMDRLQSAVDKTGGDAEHQAMNELRDYVGSRA